MLNINEWCWTDVAYFLRNWMIISFKKSYNRFKINKIFNYILSRIKIRNEHIIKYVKNRFQFLKELRIQIQNEKNIKYVVVWINFCIILHGYVIDEKKYFVNFALDDVKFKWKYRVMIKTHKNFKNQTIQAVKLMWKLKIN